MFCSESPPGFFGGGDETETGTGGTKPTGGAGRWTTTGIGGAFTPALAETGGGGMAADPAGVTIVADAGSDGTGGSDAAGGGANPVSVLAGTARSCALLRTTDAPMPARPMIATTPKPTPTNAVVDRVRGSPVLEPPVVRQPTWGCIIPAGVAPGLIAIVAPRAKAPVVVAPGEGTEGGGSRDTRDDGG